jgi:hypothetical protein
MPGWIRSSPAARSLARRGGSADAVSATRRSSLSDSSSSVGRRTHTPRQSLSPRCLIENRISGSRYRGFDAVGDNIAALFVRRVRQLKIMKPASTLALALLLIAGPSFGQDWERANVDVRRLEPLMFQQLPPPVLQHLRQRGCTIPQSFAATSPSGVIRGHFTSTRQFDWAVLCSVERTSTILVFRGGSVATVDELARHPDSMFLQAVGPPNAVGFSRAIGVAGPEHIRSAGRGAEARRPDHDGIEDSFIEKSSTIWYWDGGRWRELPGAD